MSISKGSKRRASNAINNNDDTDNSEDILVLGEAGTWEAFQSTQGAKHVNKNKKIKQRGLTEMSRRKKKENKRQSEHPTTKKRKIIVPPQKLSPPRSQINSRRTLAWKVDDGTRRRSKCDLIVIEDNEPNLQQLRQSRHNDVAQVANALETVKLLGDRESVVNAGAKSLSKSVTVITGNKWKEPTIFASLRKNIPARLIDSTPKHLSTHTGIPFCSHSHPYGQIHEEDPRTPKTPQRPPFSKLKKSPVHDPSPYPILLDPTVLTTVSLFTTRLAVLQTVTSTLTSTLQRTLCNLHTLSPPNPKVPILRSWITGYEAVLDLVAAHFTDVLVEQEALRDLLEERVWRDWEEVDVALGRARKGLQQSVKEWRERFERALEGISGEAVRRVREGMR
ncbi:hypothetical protein B0J11DRAFT_577313 [Dendryphion nanum]|uniref:Uncharacterized protein n=1 Tax=Dendryphion nanum TaxID=256645 RepID=A0A9P9IVK9_9PLEO|nr:hypothetical protein B0J11DRAFT_577313 [Dendryphion nanum]